MPLTRTVLTNYIRPAIFLLAVFYCVFPGMNSQSLQAQEGFWTRHVIDASHSGADGVRLADINGDSLMDIATGWEEGGFSKVYIHPGYEKVKQAWPSVVAGSTPSVEDAVFADLDNDGFPDVISSTEGDSKKIFINWSPSDVSSVLDPGSWTSEVLPASDGLMKWMFAIPMEVDGVNGLDFIAGSKGNGAKIGWFEAPENPRILADWKWHPISPATWVMSLFLRDMDGDGDLDVVTSDRKAGATQGVRWLENPGPGPDQKLEWINHFMGARSLEVLFMDMADLDGDGLEDALVTELTNQKMVYMRREDSTGLHWTEYEIELPEISGRAKAVRVGDVDLDGVMDIVHSANTLKDMNHHGVIWLSARDVVTDSIWEWHPVSGPIGYKFDRIELIDLDGDQDLDVLTTEENYGSNSWGLGVIWYENPLHSITQVSIEEVSTDPGSDLQLEVYPNPTQGEVYFILPDEAFSGDLYLYNSLGVPLEHFKLGLEGAGDRGIQQNGETRGKINLENYPDGVYFFKANIKGNTWIMRILLMK